MTPRRVVSTRLFTSLYKFIKAIRYHKQWIYLACPGGRCRLAFHPGCAGWWPSAAQAEAARIALANGDDHESEEKDDSEDEEEEEGEEEEWRGFSDDEAGEEEEEEVPEWVQVQDVEMRDTPRGERSYILRLHCNNMQSGGSPTGRGRMVMDMLRQLQGRR
ncbi:hypothetical protein FN846DRAFT_903435 [Sphaerosporella brunnea]|uniref:Uncharacterized protein n=1 Tax=Sphaerosporella brunnea TaxID=1250544 RepID=A0A5J5F6S2_9PEZI|nr:hypothetical protein FN846DRAFT_903435 [Sphaerosporella brunnea]